MSDENKKNRVDLGGSGSNSFEEPIINDDYELTNSSSSGGIMGYVFMGLIIVALVISYYMINKGKEKLEKNLSVVKAKLAKIEKEKTQERIGNLHIKIEDPEKDLPEEEKTSAPGVEIYINGEQQTGGNGSVDMLKQNISHDLVFEFKKPGYYPLKLEVKSCNWKKQADGTYLYENKNLHLVIDENGMMAIEAAKKEKDKEAKNRSGKKKKRRRRRR